MPGGFLCAHFANRQTQCKPARLPCIRPSSGRGDLASAGCGSRAGETRGAARLPRYRVLAAGVAVTVALCLSLAGTIRVMPLRSMPGSHVVRAMALVRFADDNPECSPALGPGQPGDRATLIRAPGADRASTGPDMACLPAYREFPVRHLPVSSWWRFPRVRPAIRALTARTPVPGPHAGSRHGNAISDHGRDGTRRPGAASGDRGHDGIRLVSARRAGPSGRPGSAAGRRGHPAGSRRAASCPARAGRTWRRARRSGDARRAGKSAGPAGTWDAVTVPACRAARPGTG